MLVDTKLQICNEVSLKIEQCFLAKDQNAKVLRIYSHSNALDQCRRWVTKHYPHAQLIPVSSTAEAAKKASKENFSAAIASQVAAKIYALYILQKAIQDSLENFTRFLVIGKVTPAPSGKDKTSLVFVVKNKVGALYEALGIFEKNNVSLTKIEARPTKKKAWEYMFFVDFNGYVKDQNIDKTIKSLESKTIFVKSLGSYPRA
jgi:chorismate mutase/prephenate dehydratase